MRELQPSFVGRSSVAIIPVNDSIKDDTAFI